jgi:hypothetical protein
MRPRVTYANVVSTLCLFLLLAGGTAYALDGSNTVFTDDIVNGDVKVADIGQGAVATDELANNQVKAADIGDGEVKAAEIANGQVGNAELGPGVVRSSNVLDNNLTGSDIAGNSLKGADIDEGTLDIGDAARAYARSGGFLCETDPVECEIDHGKGISRVTREEPGRYCVIAPGIDAVGTPAIVGVDWTSTAAVEGHASAMPIASGCGPDNKGFRVETPQRHPTITVDAGGGVNNASAVGPAVRSDNVGFVIVIP